MTRRPTAQPFAAALGAEVSGVDLAAPLDDGDIATIRQALLDHLVLVFRDQRLDDEALAAFGERFGRLQVHPNLRSESHRPEVIVIRKEPGDARIVGAEWHADTTCLPAPPMGAVLQAIEVPPLGGDTLFANQYLAYEQLSAGMRTMLDGLRAVHDDTRVAGPRAELAKGRSTRVRDDDAWRPTVSEHPVVRVHPETGRRSLFVNVSYTRRFVDMTDEESAPLLQWLYDHATRPEVTCRVRW